eukprot:Selendium_serpulae@DN4948_c0_g2_i2.p1
MPAYLPKRAAKLGLKSKESYEVRKLPYGFNDAPRHFTTDYKRRVKSLGWEEVAESIWIKRHDNQVIGAKTIHVDDLQLFGDNITQLTNELKEKKFRMTKERMLKDGVEDTMLGVEIVRNNRTIEMSHRKYTENLMLNEVSDKPLRAKDFLPPQPSDVDTSLVKEYQTTIGCLGWMAKLRPDVTFAFSELSRYNTKPSPQLLNILRRVCLMVKKEKIPLKYCALDDEVCLRVWSDASYSLNLFEGRVGWKALLQARSTPIESEDNMLSWQSKRLTEKLASSTSAELKALLRGVKNSYKFLEIIRCLWTKVHVEFYIDSEPLRYQLVAGRSEQEPRMNGIIRYIQQELTNLQANVHLVPTEIMKADHLTKWISK